jgi:hypothetical protein
MGGRYTNPLTSKNDSMKLIESRYKWADFNYPETTCSDLKVSKPVSQTWYKH